MDFRFAIMRPPPPKNQNITRHKPVVDKYLDKNGEWRAKIRMAMNTMNEANKRKFLEHYEEHGNFPEAASFIGLSTNTVKRHMADDEEFAEAVLIASEKFDAKLMRHFQSLIFDGTEKQIFNGKGDLIATERQYPYRLIEMAMRARFPEMREKQEVDHKVTGGVMLIPGGADSIEDWKKKYGEKVIDVQKSPMK